MRKGHDVVVLTASDRGEAYLDDDNGIKLMRVRSIYNPFWKDGPIPLIGSDEAEEAIADFQAELEDIAQDIFLKLFRSIERFDPDRGVKFTTWTYAFVRNHCFDVLKKRRVKTTSLTYVDDEDRQREIPDAATPQPRLTMETRELGRKIEEALSMLGEEQRMVFVLREYEGLEYGAIAQVMGVSEGTIKSRLHRAKEALRNRLAPYLRTGS